MEDYQKERLIVLSRELRKVAEPKGMLHGWWDTIFDIEAFVGGKETLLVMTAEEWVAYAEGLLEKAGLPIPE